VPEIAPHELYSLFENETAELLILDVRTRLEWETSRVAGAINVPITELSGKLPALALPKDAAVVAICLSAHRSIPAVRLLKAHGIRDVRQLKGGMLAWWKAGLPVEKHT
jgi:rhodanese-related sulfurtransferase